MNFVCEALRQSQDTLVISATTSAKEYLRRLACARAGLRYRKIQEGFSTRAKMAQAIASAEALAREPLYVVEPVDAPLPPLPDFIEKQLEAMNAALVTPRLVVIQGVELFLDDASETETLENLLLRLNQLAHHRGITLVLLHRLRFPRADTPKRLTRAQWTRKVPPEIVRHSNLCLLISGINFERIRWEIRPDKTDQIRHPNVDATQWRLDVLKRTNGGVDALPICRMWDDSELLIPATVDGFTP